jgi:hypothetical protein
MAVAVAVAVAVAAEVLVVTELLTHPFLKFKIQVHLSLNPIELVH